MCKELHGLRVCQIQKCCVCTVRGDATFTGTIGACKVQTGKERYCLVSVLWPSMFVYCAAHHFVVTLTACYQVVEAAWSFALSHAKWREDLRMDEMLRDCNFEAAAKSLSRADILGLISPRVVWFDASQLNMSSPAASSGPVLFVQMPKAEDEDAAGEIVEALMQEVAVALEWANARLGVGATQQAQVLVDFSLANDSILRACGALILEHVGKPRVQAMFAQAMGRIQQAAHPPPSRLPLDHYPACFHSIVLLVPRPRSSPPAPQQDELALQQQACRALALIWPVAQGLANTIPMVDTLASALLLDRDTRAITKVIDAPTDMAGILGNIAAQARNAAK